ncbi:diphthine methyltransferase [Macrosteles quadrilineatus]|uniref:diphthine methyltransferase n=1 Tax=Macrosteles quadrilineatus TaxID=74068 RepID=UPI0023E3401F|nr:diphthine methyltransferase [Macrosteles quadrilineatus]
MAQITTLVSWDTELSADSVEWCPFPSKHQLLVCGTYQLIEGEDQLTSSRQGKLHLLSFMDSEVKELSLLQTVHMPAVLDCKWAPQLIQDKALLGVVNAAGQLVIYKLIEGDETLPAKLVEELSINLPSAEDKGEVLALALDWSVSCDVRISVSDSKGRISIFCLDTAGLKLEHNWTAHEYEAWTVHIDRFCPNTIYTGGDDAKLRAYDLRTDLHSAKLTSTRHSAGVTSFAQSSQEHQLLSGSYDEHILQWDTRRMQRPVHSVHTGGGVWRMRFNTTEDMLLAACMYDGFHIYDKDLTAVASYREHSSIAYGAHWSHATTHNIMATCSFYDHKLNVSCCI